jgi:hypothetical protein
LGFRAAATPFWIPVDIVSQRLQLQGVGSVVHYKNARGAFVGVILAWNVHGSWVCGDLFAWLFSCGSDYLQHRWVERLLSGHRCCHCNLRYPPFLFDLQFFEYLVMDVHVAAPASAIWWASYEYCKKIMVAHHLDVDQTDSSRHADGSPLVHATAGFISGSISSIVTNPLDIVKTRIQTQDVDTSVQHKSKGVLEELTRMLRVEGPKSVFRGMYVVISCNTFRSVPLNLSCLCRQVRTDNVLRRMQQCHLHLLRTRGAMEQLMQTKRNWRVQRLVVPIFTEHKQGKRRCKLV